MSRAKPKLLFHTYNRRGLGHFVRASNIARELQQLSPEVEIAFFSRGAPPSELLLPRITYVHDTLESVPLAASPLVPQTATWAALLHDFQPDVVVYDTVVPSSLPWEDANVRPAVAYVMRKSHAQRHSEICASPFLRKVDLILVPHERHEFGHELPDALPAPTHFVGTITRKPSEAGRTRMRQRYALNADQHLVVSTPGGGGFTCEAETFFNAVAQMHARLQNQVPNLRHLVIQGMKFDGVVGALPGMDVIPQEPDLVDLLSLANIVVSAAGYNTVNELRLTKTPSILWPSPRTHDDQAERAIALAQRGLAIAVPTDLASEEVPEFLARYCADHEAQQQMRIAYANDSMLIGNERAAQLLLELATR